jgi:hypothetical protein
LVLNSVLKKGVPNGIPKEQCRLVPENAGRIRFVENIADIGKGCSSWACKSCQTGFPGFEKLLKAYLPTLTAPTSLFILQM